MKNFLLFAFLLALVAGGVYIYKSRGVEAPSAVPEHERVPEPARETTYSCEGGSSVRATFSGRTASLIFNDTRTVALAETTATYGSRYASQDGRTVFWVEGTGAYVEEDGKRTFADCRSITAGTPTPKGDEVRMYQNTGYGITFYYPALYYLREREVGTSAKPQRVIVMVEDTKENRDLLDGTSKEVREGPTSMTLDIYENPDELSAPEWAKQDTNWNLGSKKTTKTSVGGVDGVSFTWDGLYAGKSTVVTRGKYAYVFSVTWMKATDRITRDVEAVLRSVIFAE